MRAKRESPLVPKTLADFVNLRAVERLRAVEPALQKAADDTGSAKRIHKLRVAGRKAIECLRTFEPFFDPTTVKKTERRLKKLTDACSDLRDLNVALDLLKTVRKGSTKFADGIRKKQKQQ